VGGKQITAEEALGMLKAVGPDDLKRFAGNLPQLVQQLYIQRQFAEQALQQHLDEQSPYKEQLKIAHDNILAQAYLAKLTAPSGPPPDLQQYYNAHIGDFDEVKISGIFVQFSPPGTPSTPGKPPRTEDEAKAKATDLEQKIKGGADFAVLAKTETDNPRGADLGSFRVNDKNLPPNVRTIIAQLQPGDVSAPVRQPNGFYIFKATSRSKKSFQEVQGEILQTVQTERGQAIVKEQFDKYQVNVQDPDFFNASAPAPAQKIPSLASPKPAPPPTKP
jgi:peptidyl-prolyl cis-trans isomerase C